MRTNREGVELIMSCEGLRLDAYPDPGTGADPWTIGYGHTGPDVCEGMTIDCAAAEYFLLCDIAATESGVERLVSVSVTGNEFSALVSFAYNVGLESLRKSTLLRKLNAGDRQGAAVQFLRWNRAAGRVLPGLTHRRALERDLFLTPGDGTAIDV